MLEMMHTAVFHLVTMCDSVCWSGKMVNVGDDAQLYFTWLRQMTEMMRTAAFHLVTVCDNESVLVREAVADA